MEILDRLLWRRRTEAPEEDWTTKKVAKDALKDVQAKITKGEYLGIYEERKTPFKTFAEKPEDDCSQCFATSFERFEGIVNNHLIPAFPVYLTKISKKQIQEYVQKRAEEVKPATVNHEMKRLRHMMGKAV